MARQELVIFDGDDTLWEVEPLYDAALDRSAQVVAAANLPAAEWRAIQREFDLANVVEMGMSPDRFPRSSAQALEEVARRHGVAASPALTNAVVEASKSVFEMTAQPISSARALLDTLRPKCLLALLTKGDERVQTRRVDASGLKHYFDRIQIVPEKTDAVFAALVAEFDRRPSEAWSIGNSLASDINPALRAGLHAIWVDAHVWEHERRETVAVDPRLVVLEDLELAAGFLLGTPSRKSAS